MARHVNKKPVSAVVVAYNEAHLIKDCLESLAFCDEIFLIDLGSRDETVRIAESCRAKILHHPWVQIGEQARQFGISRAKHDWVINIDPDERISETLPDQMWNAVQQNENIGVVAVQYTNYFMNKELTSTRWGYVKKLRWILYHKSRVEFGTRVHTGCFLKNGFLEHRIPFDGTNALVHLWVTNLSVFFRKHWKYITMEGEAQYYKGNRFSWKRLFIQPVRELKKNLWNQGGVRGGPVGIFLSFFWAWYLVMRELSLANYQFKKAKNPSPAD
jgi:glycosyltransferase involved in cell wall biosynthesis